MKKRDIILDFTSLLDVTLIVIFFFVLFSHMENENNVAQTEAKINELDKAIEQAENREAEAELLYHQWETELEILENKNERLARNLKEMGNFRKSENLKIIMELQGGELEVRVIAKENVVKKLTDLDNVCNELINIMRESGYETEDTFFCELIFDSENKDTNTAYRRITQGLAELKKEYTYFYYSVTDLSTGRLVTE